MQRRKFIRLAGGGVVAVAAAPLTGCSTDFPAAAVAPWAGPQASTDLRRWAVAHAILAPNSHNRQPWLVDLRQPDSISLYVDRDRLLPETDPWFRQIVVSQGTFVETLALALHQRGVEPKVELFPEGEFAPRALDSRPVARLSWQAGASGARPDPLFAQVLRRHTAKVAYDTTRPVTAATLQALAEPAALDGVSFGATVDPKQVQALRELCLAAARIELNTPRTVLESARLTRVGPSEILQHRDGISINSWMPRLASMVGGFDRTQAPAADSTAMKTMVKRFEEHSLTAMGFVWLATPWARDLAAGRGRSAEVNAGRAYMRLQLKATELGLQVHPMSQAPQEFAEMRPHYEKLHQLLLAQPPGQQVVQMFCRVGYCTDQQHTPRRDPATFLRG